MNNEYLKFTLSVITGIGLFVAGIWIFDGNTMLGLVTGLGIGIYAGIYWERKG